MPTSLCRRLVVDRMHTKVSGVQELYNLCYRQRTIIIEMTTRGHLPAKQKHKSTTAVVFVMVKFLQNRIVFSEGQAGSAEGNIMN